MAARNEVLAAESVAKHLSSTEFQTENGFSIARLSEIDNSVPAVGVVHRFLVRDPDGFELEITVEIVEKLARALAQQSRGCLSTESSYWIFCAERHLAQYLWENGDYPPNAKLSVEQPTLDDVDLAARWDSQSSKRLSREF